MHSSNYPEHGSLPVLSRHTLKRIPQSSIIDLWIHPLVPCLVSMEVCPRVIKKRSLEVRHNCSCAVQNMSEAMSSCRNMQGP